jgi:hypothetical protein
MNWSVLLAARVDCCSGWKPVCCVCDLCRCHVMTRVATLSIYISRGLGVLATSPPPGGGQLLTSCCAFAVCAWFQVTSCLLLKVRVYLSCWAWSDFPTGGALQSSFVLLHPCLRILLAIYSEATACMQQLMCTAVSQLNSDQLIPLHHYAHLMYPPCLYFLYVFTYALSSINAIGLPEANLVLQYIHTVVRLTVPCTTVA